jgi:DEAD/DEAH box helicase domain-containing protein
MSRLQKVETRKSQLAGTGERLMISNSYNRHNARSPVPARKKFTFCRRLKYDTFHFEYERAARAGIQEFAPANTFYAGGRKVRIDQVDLGVSRIETWRLCSECSYMELESSDDKKSVCPQCGSVSWADEGRKMNLLRMSQVFATASDARSRILDDSDQRSPEFYNR